MLENKVYPAADIDFKLTDLPQIAVPRKVLLCSPEYFNVVGGNNVYMEKNIGNIDTALAMRQWQNLKSKYDALKDRGMLEDVFVIKGVEGLEDMVFAANQSLPWMLHDKKVVVLSKMRHESRQGEVIYFKQFYEDLGYHIVELKNAQHFEGRGDVILSCARNLLFGGHGYRSDVVAYDELSAILDVPIITLRLVDPRFYHLDTCFIPVDDDTVFLIPEAFSNESLESIHRLFNHVVKIPVEEGEQFFALNTHCISVPLDGMKVAIIQQGTTIMRRELEKKGFEVIEIDTSEFIKSGGSVFCMKMMLY